MIMNNYCDPRSPGEEVLLEGKVLDMQNKKATVLKTLDGVNDLSFRASCTISTK